MTHTNSRRAKIWKGGSTIKNLNKEKYNETLNGLFNSKGGRIPSFKDLDLGRKEISSQTNNPLIFKPENLITRKYPLLSYF